MLGDYVAVLIYERLTHAFRMVDIDAEDDGLRVPVGFLEELGHLLRDLFGALFDDELPVKILLLVDAVLDLQAVVVHRSCLRPETVNIDVKLRSNDLVGSQKTVLDALFETVGVNRLAEIVDVGNAFRLLRRSGHADLDCFIEVIQDLAPGRIVRRASAMALVDDDEVEERAVKCPEYLLAVLSNKLLVKGEVDFERRIELPALNLGGYFFQRLKVAVYRLVNQDVSVRQVEDLLYSARIAQAMDDLECRIGFARACCHDQQDPFIAVGDCLNGPVDGVALVVARAHAVLPVMVRGGNGAFRGFV